MNCLSHQSRFFSGTRVCTHIIYTYKVHVISTVDDIFVGLYWKINLIWLHSENIFVSLWTFQLTHIYIYIYICIYFIKQYRYLLSTHFCIYPFELLHWFYGIPPGQVNETGTIVLSARSWTIIRGVYIAKVMGPLHGHYYFVSVYHLYWCVVVAFYF